MTKTDQHGDEMGQKTGYPVGPWRHNGVNQGILGRHGGVVQRLEASWDLLGTFLGLLKLALVPSWGHVGAFWARFGIVFHIEILH